MCRARLSVGGTSERPTTVYIRNTIFIRCLHEAIVAAIDRATDRRDDHLV